MEHARLARKSLLLFSLTIALMLLSACPFGPKVYQPPVESHLTPQSQMALLGEIFRVVLLRKIPPDREISQLESAWQAGASLEGIYNGLTHSQNYRELERNSPPATDRALHAFVDQVIKLQIRQATPQLLNKESAEPLAAPVQPGISNEGGAPPADSAAPFSEPDWRSRYLLQFKAARIFTLKRVLGDLGLQVLNEKKPIRRELADWYGDWAADLSQLKVNFGMNLRNRSDSAFHGAWAMTTSEDLLVWETLNRLHRILNQEQGL